MIPIIDSKILSVLLLGLSSFSGAFVVISQTSGESELDWFDNPCDRNGPQQYDGLPHTEAAVQLNIFINFINKTLDTLGVTDLKIFKKKNRNCQEIRISHFLFLEGKNSFENDKKARVFYNILLKWAVFLHTIKKNIPDISSNHPRISMYNGILLHLKSVTCEYSLLLTGPRIMRRFNGFRKCVQESWDETNSKLFDLQVMRSLKLFFTESSVILKDIEIRDDDLVYFEYI
ncbi:hypothetical protein JTB14_032951 [Gonioctena quinquepunctata]|nr:hypothetical protein JTB14_032951 [Gonioctena quinquepunctata]